MDTDPAAQDDPQPKTPLWMEVAGWIGTALILGAYGATSLEWMDQGHIYQAMNLAGAAGVGLICWHRRTWQAFALEAAWGTIACIALLRSGLA